MIGLLKLFTYSLVFQRVSANNVSRNTRLFGSKKEYVPDMKSLSKFYKPKTQNQEMYQEYLNDDSYKILFVTGPAGTGKTLLACNQAIKDLKRGKYQKIVITRPVVPVEEDIGFLPGNLVKKMDPWTRPIMDVFSEFYSQKDIDNMIYSNIIEISPLAYMRGRTFKNAIIIGDEMQNSSGSQMLMLVTRIGLGSKMILTGDLDQRDGSRESGLEDIIKRLKNYKKKYGEKGIKQIELTREDIKREEIINTILDIYKEEKELAFLDYDKIRNEMEEDKKELDIIYEKEEKKEKNDYDRIMEEWLEDDKKNSDAALIPFKDQYIYRRTKRPENKE